MILNSLRQIPGGFAVGLLFFIPFMIFFFWIAELKLKENVRIFIWLSLLIQKLLENNLKIDALLTQYFYA